MTSVSYSLWQKWFLSKIVVVVVQYFPRVILAVVNSSQHAGCWSTSLVVAAH